MPLLFPASGDTIDPCPMSSDSSVLMVNVQVALHLTEPELGALIGVTKRTIQRWQDGVSPRSTRKKRPSWPIACVPRTLTWPMR